MTRDANIALAHRYFEAVNGGDLSVLDTILSSAVVQHTPGIPPGIGSVKAILRMFREAFPDLRAEVQWTLADGDSVIVRSVTQGTHTATFMGHPATGRRFSATGLDVLRIADGLIAERWSEFDTFGMLAQLGLAGWQASAGRAGGR